MLFENVMLLVVLLLLIFSSPFGWSFYVKYIYKASTKRHRVSELGPGIKSHLFSIIVVQSVQCCIEVLLFFLLVFLLPFWCKTRQTFYFSFPMPGIDGNKSHKVQKYITIYNIPYPALLLFLLFPWDISRLLSFNAATEINCEIHKLFAQSFFLLLSPLCSFLLYEVWCLIRCDVFMDHRKHNRNDNAFDSLNLLCWTNWVTMKCKHVMS